MSGPVFSVVIDNYNYGRFLGQAVDSVLAQDLPADRFEVIVVDDGSTDDSREVLARYGNRVRPIFQENRGCAAALSRGFAEARGELVSILDADDVWGPDKLRKVLARFSEEPDLVGVQHALHDTDAALVPLPVRYPDWPARYVLDDYLEGRVALGVASGLTFKKAALEDALPIPEAFRFLYQDDYLSVRALFKGPVGNITERLGSHRGHGGNNFSGGRYASAAKLEAFLAAHAVFSAKRDGWLRDSGRVLSPRLLSAERLELIRCEVLLASHQGRKRDAFAAWRRLAAEGGLGLFRSATLLTALHSPALYLRLHAYYAGQSWMSALRRRLLPELAGH